MALGVLYAQHLPIWQPDCRATAVPADFEREFAR
jgi:hypothetical protein